MEIITQEIELSTSQKRMWLLQKQHYPLNNLLSLSIRGNLDKERLKMSIERLMANHEIFRTSYTVRQSMMYPTQKIHDQAGALTFHLHDLQELCPADKDIQTGCIIDNMLSAENDAAACSLNVSVVSMSACESLVIMSLPSLNSDAHTLNNIARELMAHYSGHGDSFEEAAQFGQFSEWQSDLLKNGDEEAAAFWAEQRQDENSMITLPFAFRQRDQKKYTKPVVSPLPMNDTIRRKINGYLESNQVSLSAFLLSCWNILIWQYDQDAPAVVIGKIENERTYREFDTINGPIGRALPVRIKLSATDTIANIVQQVQGVETSVKDWQDSFQLADAGPAFSIGFELAEFSPLQDMPDDLCANIHKIACHNELFRLKLFACKTPGQLAMDLYYDPEHLDSKSIERIKEHFINIISNVLTQDNQTFLSDIITPSERELYRVSSLFNNHRLETQRPETLIRSFALQAQKTPAQIAVVFNGEEVTYRELDDLSNRLAGKLRGDYNLTMGDIAVLKFHRSIEFIVGMLAVLKTGAAYLPVDNNTPLTRFAFMVNDAAARVVITDKDPEIAGLKAPVLVLRKADLANDRSVYISGTNTTEADPVYVIYTSGSTGTPNSSCRHLTSSVGASSV